LEKVALDVAQHRVLAARLSASNSIAEEAGLLAAMEALEVDDRYLAFADKGTEEQHRCILAASYSDVWSEIRSSKGVLVGGISSWYICMAKTEYGPPPAWSPAPCLRVTPSKDWGRKFQDPLAVKQKYYCPRKTCECKYNASWGQLVEISRVGAQGLLERFYVRADVPSWDVEDVRAMYLEESLAPASAAELYRQLKRVVPAVTDVVIADDAGCRKVRDAPTWESIPTFKWVEIFNFAGIDPPAAVVGKKKR
jgi:hypothetical protein